MKKLLSVMTLIAVLSSCSMPGFWGEVEADVELVVEHELEKSS